MGTQSLGRDTVIGAKFDPLLGALRTSDASTPAVTFRTPVPTASGENWCVPGWVIPGTTTRSYVNQVRLIPIFVSGTTTYQTIGINVSSAATAGSLCRMGIYTFSNKGASETLLLDAGTVAIDTTGAKTKSISLALTRGFYMIAYVANNTATFTGASTACIPPYQTYSNGVATTTDGSTFVATDSSYTANGFPSTISIAAAGVAAVTYCCVWMQEV